MGFFSDIMGAVSSWITAKKNVAELKYQRKIAEQDNKQFHKKQWDRLFCSEDYNSVKLLQKFIDSNNEWIKIDENFKDALSSAKFCGLYKYDDVEIYFDGEKFPLFQIDTRIIKSKKYYGERKIDYIRITPKIYTIFKKQYKVYQKKGLL